MKYNSLKTKVYKRRRGTAIIETEKGILVVAGSNNLFLLPGGAADKYESRIEATIRELREETSLKAYSVKFLFSHEGGVHKCSSKLVRDYHKVFLVEAEGNPKPCKEIEQIDYYQPQKKIKISKSTKTIIEKYCVLKQ